MTEIERSVLTAMFNRVVYPEDLRDAAAVDAADRRARRRGIEEHVT